VTDEEKRDAETKADATQADMKAPIASSAACEPNPVLEQNFKPAELQAALGASPLVSFVELWTVVTVLRLLTLVVLMCSLSTCKPKMRAALLCQCSLLLPQRCQLQSQHLCCSANH